MSATPFRDYASRYARAGIPVFPVVSRGKEPLVDRGFHAASRDPAQIAAWIRKYPDANIGCCPGGAGWLVFDLDGPEGKNSAVPLGLRAEPTLIVETGRGEHVYTLHPGGHIGNLRVAQGIDVRADAGYVLMPGSIHPSGAIYTAVGDISDIIPCPPAALEALRPPAREPLDPIPIEAGSYRRRRYVERAIELELLGVATAPEGRRNNALNRAGFSLARFVETNEADPGRLADALMFAALQGGLEEREISQTIHSAFRARGVRA